MVVGLDLFNDDTRPSGHISRKKIMVAFENNNSDKIKVANAIFLTCQFNVWLNMI